MQDPFPFRLHSPSNKHTVLTVLLWSLLVSILRILRLIPGAHRTFAKTLAVALTDSYQDTAIIYIT